MVLDTPVSEVIRRVGHDGSQIVWPVLDDPYKRRGFHPQEMIDLAYRLGKRVITIEAIPVSIGSENQEGFEIPMDNEARWMTYLSMEYGVLAGNFGGRQHAVAWDKHKIIDNDGLFYPLRKMQPHTFFAVDDV